MTITSTVPGAVTTVQGYMTTVAQANPSLGAEVYVGAPIGEVVPNFMMVGHPDDGALIVADSYDWATLPGTTMRRSEAYALQLTIRAWAGDVDSSSPVNRLADAFTMLTGLHEQIVADLGGSGTLSPSGSWGQMHVTMAANGPLDGMGGWGVVLAVELHVTNVEISG